MRVICSWCKKVLGKKEPFDDPSQTEGKCAECAMKHKVSDDPAEQAQIEAELRVLAELLIDLYAEDCRQKRQGAGGNVQVSQ